MKTYDVFLIDADGTLYDFDTAEANALNMVFDKYGFVYSDNFLLTYREISAQLWTEFEKGEISINSLQALRFSRLFEELDITGDASEFNQDYLIELGKGIFLKDFALDICKELNAKGKKIYIVTNGIYKVQKPRITNSPLIEYISDCFVSELIGHQKPSTEYFDHVFFHIQAVEKDKTILIGDSLTADIAGGNNAGIDTCWYNDKKANNQTGIKPTYEINHLSELRLFI